MRFREQNWMTFRSAYTTLFIYIQAIVLLAPGNVTISVSRVRQVVREKRGETDKGD